MQHQFINAQQLILLILTLNEYAMKKIFYTLILLLSFSTVFGQTTNSSIESRANRYLKNGIENSNLKDSQGAIADFSQAIKINPNYAEAYLSRGAIKYFLGDRKEACQDWEKARVLGDSKANDLIQKYCR